MSSMEHRFADGDSESTDAALQSVKRRYFALFVLLTLVDGIQTTLVVSQSGAIAELNPIIKLALEQFSLSGLWWIKAAAITAVYLALNRIRGGVLLASLILLAAVVASNAIQMTQRWI